MKKNAASFAYHVVDPKRLPGQRCRIVEVRKVVKRCRSVAVA
jgi:hypothetical protein